MNKKSKHKLGKRSDRYWIYGKHAVIAAANNPRRNVHRLFATTKTRGEIKPHIDRPIHTEEVESGVISEKLQDGALHQGVACEVSDLADLSLNDLDDPKFIIMLDQVTDPHNVGAILRSAAAFNVDAVILPRDNSPSETGSLAKSASGALEVVPIVKVTNLSKTLEQLKEDDFWVIGLDGKSDTLISQIPDYDKIVLVLGAEGRGLRRLTESNCDILASIPISDNVESLNVSNAASVTLYEIASKR